MIALYFMAYIIISNKMNDHWKSVFFVATLTLTPGYIPGFDRPIGPFIYYNWSCIIVTIFTLTPGYKITAFDRLISKQFL
jgi:hypothetical protein